MRLVTLSACIAVAFVLAAKAEEAPTDQYYFAQSLQRDAVRDIITEPEFRAIFLRGLEGPNPDALATVAQLREGEDFFKQDEATIIAQLQEPYPSALDELNLKRPLSYLVPAADVPSTSECKEVRTLLDDALDKIPHLIESAISSIEKLQPYVWLIEEPVKKLVASIRASIYNYSKIIFGPLNSVFTAILTAIQPWFKHPNISIVLHILQRIQKNLSLFAICIGPSVDPSTQAPTAIFGLTAMSTFDVNHCSLLADIYREGVIASAQYAPKVSESASEEMKRLTSGSHAVLGLMAKTSIASKNDDLLATRPIFATRLLENYREGLLQQPLEEDWKEYAQVNLGLLVSVSNSLEACLHVSADPVAAADGLEEELAFE
ncbi:hypothetical protein EMPS_08341 [Entomortierella parvispora]|uniref:Uncharacterized protein n=1 Tax=Entomortierella parvispora TaxID=205924 RepID=A0A9P3LZA8_9FUNG|nr:hypothetical protein EMPS_08341 [Entomortierella parvispora]